jgi:hypothetical protein
MPVLSMSQSFEDEHQVPDATAVSGRRRLRRSSAGLADAAIEAVEQFRTARTPPRCSRIGPPSSAQLCSMTPDTRARRTSGGISPRLARRRAPPSACRRQLLENSAALLGVQMREDDRGRLRMLPRKKRDSMLGIDALERRERALVCSDWRNFFQNAAV